MHFPSCFSMRKARPACIAATPLVEAGLCTKREVAFLDKVTFGPLSFLQGLHGNYHSIRMTSATRCGSRAVPAARHAAAASSSYRGEGSHSRPIPVRVERLRASLV